MCSGPEHFEEKGELFMKDEKATNSTKRKYVKAKAEKVDFSGKDVISYSWDENVPDDGWQIF